MNQTTSFASSKHQTMSDPTLHPEDDLSMFDFFSCDDELTNSFQMSSQPLLSIGDLPLLDEYEHSPISGSAALQMTDHCAFDYKLNDTLEPTPFREDFSLQTSASSSTKIVLGTDIFDLNSFVSCEYDYEPTWIRRTASLKRKIQSDYPSKCKRIKCSNNTDADVPSIQLPTKNIDGTNVQLKPHQEDRWDSFYLCLLDFKELHGHSHVPHSYPQDPALARWSKRQRFQYKLHIDGKPNTLTSDRLEKLESVGFIWDPQGTVWETRLQELVEYAREYGDCNVPCRFAKNPQLGMWVKRQRRQYKQCKSGKSSRLSEDRFRILSDMGFVWEVRGESCM